MQTEPTIKNKEEIYNRIEARLRPLPKRKPIIVCYPHNDWLYRQYCENTEPTIAETFIRKCANDFCSATHRQYLAGHEPIELTNDEKFAIAVAAGVKTHLKEDNGSYRMETEKCAVVWDGQGFSVLMEQNQQSRGTNNVRSL